MVGSCEFNFSVCRWRAKLCRRHSHKMVRNITKCDQLGAICCNWMYCRRYKQAKRNFRENTVLFAEGFFLGLAMGFPENNSMSLVFIHPCDLCQEATRRCLCCCGHLAAVISFAAFWSTRKAEKSPTSTGHSNSTIIYRWRIFQACLTPEVLDNNEEAVRGFIQIQLGFLSISVMMFFLFFVLFVSKTMGFSRTTEQCRTKKSRNYMKSHIHISYMIYYIYIYRLYYIYIHAYDYICFFSPKQHQVSFIFHPKFTPGPGNGSGADPCLAS